MKGIAELFKRLKDHSKNSYSKNQKADTKKDNRQILIF